MAGLRSRADAHQHASECSFFSLSFTFFIKFQHMSLKLIIIYYISSGATNIAEVSGQADWSTTLGIVYCYPISFFVLVYLFTCLSELDSNNKRADENVSSI